MKSNFMKIFSIIFVAITFNISLLADTTIWQVRDRSDANHEGTFRYAVNHAKDGDMIIFIQDGQLKPIFENIHFNQKKLIIYGRNQNTKEMTKLPFGMFSFNEGADITFQEVHFQFPKDIYFVDNNFNFNSCIIDPYEEGGCENIYVRNGRIVKFKDCQFRGNSNTSIAAAGVDSLINISHCRIDGYICRYCSRDNTFRRKFEVCAYYKGKVVLSDDTYFSKAVMPEKIDKIKPWIDTTYFKYKLGGGGTIKGSIREGDKYENVNLTSEIMILD